MTTTGSWQQFNELLEQDLQSSPWRIRFTSISYKNHWYICRKRGVGWWDISIWYGIQFKIQFRVNWVRLGNFRALKSILIFFVSECCKQNVRNFRVIIFGYENPYTIITVLYHNLCCLKNKLLTPSKHLGGVKTHFYLTHHCVRTWEKTYIYIYP